MLFPPLHLHLLLRLLPVCHCPSQLKPERFEAAAKEVGFPVTMRMQVGTGGGWACCACMHACM